VIGGCAWDIKIDLVEFWKQVKRLAKDDHSPVLMFCNTKFGNELINSNPKWFRHDLVWDKGRGVSFLSANKMPMKSHEMVYVFSKKGVYYNRIDIKGDFKATPRVGGMKGSKTHNVSNVYNSRVEDTRDTPPDERCAVSVIKVNNSAGKGKHPTEKPMELYEWLLSRYVRKDGLVLDPTAGSFNSILVAKRLGFKAIGIEMDNKFYWKGVDKLLHL
jgi:site-specific DNA-methyltransferase (adenine-specific)